MTRGLWRRGKTVPTLLLIGLAACPQDYSISIDSNSRRESLLFRFGGRGGAAVERIEVRRCTESGLDSAAIVWAVTYPGRGGVSTVKYGEIPSGFSPLVEPRTLTPGCYVVQAPPDEVSATFRVLPDGRVESSAP